MSNQSTQLQFEFTEPKTIHVVRYGDIRARDSEGRFVGEVGDTGDQECRLREQLHILRTNCSIWLANRDKEIAELK